MLSNVALLSEHANGAHGDDGATTGMIVSGLESLFLRLLLGGAMDCARRGQYGRVRADVEALIAWAEQPGVTEAAQIEIDEGQEIRRL